MQQKREQRVLFGKLDFDSDARYVQAGDYIDIRNFRGSRTDTGRDGTIENVKSLNEVTSRVDRSGSNASLPNGVNKCIGTYTSESTRRSFMWVWNSEGNHTIWQYSFTSDEITLLVQDREWASPTPPTWAAGTYNATDVVLHNGSYYICVFTHTTAGARYTSSPSTNRYYWKELSPYLNFDEFQLIYDIVEITRDDDTLLIWTDGENQVKYINADRMGSALRVSTEFPKVFEEEYFDLVPYTPQMSIPIYDWEAFDITGLAANVFTSAKVTTRFLKTGDRVVYSGSGLTGVTSGNEYYFIRISAITFSLASTRANAFAGTALVITGTPSAFDFITRAETVGSGSDPSISTLNTKAYQFRYQWEYLDGMKSPWSPISKIPLLPQSSPIPRQISGSTFALSGFSYICNTLHLKIPRRDPYTVSYLQKINVAVREVNDGNSGDWYIIKDINALDTTQTNDPTITALQSIDESKLGSTNVLLSAGANQYTDFYEWDFNGTEPRIAISQLETDELFSWLPKKVRSLCLVGDNRIFAANGTEGNDIGFSNPFISDYVQTVVSTPRARTFPTFGDANNYVNSRTFKRGGYHKFGVIYSDKTGRVSSVVPFSDETYVDWVTAGMAANTYAAAIDMDTQLSLAPPEWAEYYQIVYSKVRNYKSEGSNGNFRQFRISSRTAVGGWLYTYGLDILTDHYDETSQTPEFQYDFVEGDKARFLYNTTAAAWSNPYECTVTAYDAANNTITVDVSDAAGNIPAIDHWIEIYSPQLSPPEDDEIQWYEIGETYKMMLDGAGNKVHGGQTDRFPERTRDQDIGGATSNIVIVCGGDSYIRERGMGDNSGVALNVSVLGCESSRISDNFGDKSSDIGRPNIVTEEGLKEIHREATGRLSQPFIPNTDINNIGFFYGGDFTEYNKNYGSIQKVYTDSHNLTLFQEIKFGQVPVDRALIEDLEGQGLVVLTSDLLGKIRYSEEDYGIGFHGESHVAYGNYQWWADSQRNAVLELSPRGFRVISEIGCKFYFDQLFQTIAPYSNKVKLIGGYDREFDEYLLTFDVRMIPNNTTGVGYSSGVYDFTIPDSDEEVQWTKGWELGEVNRLVQQVGLNGFRAILRYYDTTDNYYKEQEGIPSDISVNPAIEGLGTGLNLSVGNDNFPYGFFRDVIAFSPKAQGWSSRYDFECDWWSQHGNKLASIKDGRFWKHNDIATSVNTYGNFYGTDYDAIVTVPFNEDAVLKKQPLAIEIETNDRTGGWSMESATNDRDQETEITSNLIVEREGDLFANILRDKNTPNKTYPLLDGDKIIGNYLIAKFKNTSNTLVNLFSLGLNYMFSNYR